MRTLLLVLLLLALSFASLTGCKSSSGDDGTPAGNNTIPGTDRYWVRFDIDRDGNSHSDFDEVLSSHGLSSSRSAIISDIMTELRKRYEYTNSGANLGELKISFSNNQPYGHTVSGSYAFCSSSDEYNVYVMVKCGSSVSSGVLGQNYQDDPTVPPNTQYNERIENLAHSTALSQPLGTYVDHIDSGLGGIFTQTLFVANVASVTAHEMGHGLGLTHSNYGNQYIMYYATLINNPAKHFHQTRLDTLKNHSLPGPHR